MQRLSDEQLDARIDELKAFLVAAGCDPNTLTLENLLAEQAAVRECKGRNMKALQTRLRKIEAAAPEAHRGHKVVFEPAGGKEQADREQGELEALGYTVIRVRFVSPGDMRERPSA